MYVLQKLCFYRSFRTVARKVLLMELMEIVVFANPQYAKYLAVILFSIIFVVLGIVITGILSLPRQDLMIDAELQFEFLERNKIEDLESGLHTFEKFIAEHNIKLKDVADITLYDEYKRRIAMYKAGKRQ